MHVFTLLLFYFGLGFASCGFGVNSVVLPIQLCFTTKDQFVHRN